MMLFWLSIQELKMVVICTVLFESLFGNGISWISSCCSVDVLASGIDACEADDDWGVNSGSCDFDTPCGTFFSFCPNILLLDFEALYTYIPQVFLRRHTRHLSGYLPTHPKYRRLRLPNRRTGCVIHAQVLSWSAANLYPFPKLLHLDLLYCE